MILYFETHSTSVDNESALASGWFDAALSATGERQARELGERYRDRELAAVFCSDLSRSVRTGEIAFAGRDLPIVHDARLRECHYGALTRCSTFEIEVHRAERLDEPFPDGESYADVVGRVAEWLAETERRFAGRTILVIGHRATFYAIEHLCRHVPLRDVVRQPWHWQPGWRYESPARTQPPPADR